MIYRHLAFLGVVSIFMLVAAFFIAQATADTVDIFRWGVVFIMGMVGSVLGGVLAYEDW